MGMMKVYVTRVILISYIVLFTLLICYHVAVIEYSRQMIQFAVEASENRFNGLEALLIRRRELEQLEYDSLNTFPHTFQVPLNRLITPTNFSCTNQHSVYVLKSRPGEFHIRQAIRETWGSEILGRLMFVLGTVATSDEQSETYESAIQLESQSYGDIFVVDFIDSYYNLSLKSLSILRYIDDNCNNTQFVIQGDADVVMFPKIIDDFTSRRIGQERRIYGGCWSKARVRREGKWALAQGDYIPLMYPVYCSGAVLIMSGDVPHRLLDVFDPRHAYFSIDDAYFTGILAEAAFVTRINVRQRIYFQQDTLPTNVETDCNCFQPLALLEYKSDSSIRHTWNVYSDFIRRCAVQR